MCVRFVVHGLIPGETYAFRVQAVNVFGLSEESQESSPIAVEPALGENNDTFKIKAVYEDKKYFKMQIKLIDLIESVTVNKSNSVSVAQCSLFITLSR